jgi:hypothetical protein
MMQKVHFYLPLNDLEVRKKCHVPLNGLESWKKPQLQNNQSGEKSVLNMCDSNDSPNR